MTLEELTVVVEELTATVDKLRVDLEELREWVRPVVEGHQKDLTPTPLDDLLFANPQPA